MFEVLIGVTRLVQYVRIGTKHKNLFCSLTMSIAGFMVPGAHTVHEAFRGNPSHHYSMKLHSDILLTNMFVR